MKKLLGSVLALTLGVACATTIVGCGNNSNGGDSDATIAANAINYVKSMYDKTSLYETNDSYEVIKRYSNNGVVYDINWTLSSVSATSNDINDYLAIVEGEDEFNYTVSVEARPEEDIEYYLTASVTVGNETASHSIKRNLVGIGVVMLPSEAKALGEKLQQGEYYKEGGSVKRIVVGGYVIDPGTYNASSSRYDAIYIADEYTKELDTTAANVLYVYRVAADSKLLTGYGALEKGDYAVFSGYIQKYGTNNIIELTYNSGNNAQCVALEKSKITDEQKVEAAYDTLALTRTKFTEIEEITLPETSCGTTLSWALTTTTDLVTLTGNTLKIVKIPEATEDIKLTATISCGSVAPMTKEIIITVAPPIVLDHAGTEDDPLSVADVQALFATLSSGEIYQVGGIDKLFYIKGYVTVVGSVNGSYGLKDVYIADNAGATKDDSILIYNLNWGVLPSGSNPLAEGDEIVLKGYLKNHYGTYEVAQSGSTYPEATKWVSSLNDEEKVAKALESVPETVTVTKEGATPLPLASYGVLFLWTGDSEVYTISGGMVNVNELPLEDVSFNATVSASYGNVKQTKTITVIVKAYVADAKGTITNPYTPSEALEAAKNLASDAYSDDVVYVKGYVVDAGYYDAGYKNFNKIYIADSDDMGIESALYVFRVQPDDTYLKGDGDLDLGDLVTFSGYLQNYKGNTPELTYQGSVSVYCVALEKVTLTPAEQIAKALAKVADTLTITAAGETGLASSTVKDVTFEWVVKSGTAATISNGKLNVATLPAEDATVVLTVTATHANGTSSTKDVTVTIKAAPQGEQSIAAKTLQEYGTANGWTNGTRYDTIELDSNITVTATGTPNGDYALNTGKYYTNNSSYWNWRIYQNENPRVTITAKAGCTILRVKITYEIDKTGILTNADKTVQYASGDVIAVNASTVTFSVGNTGTATNGQVRITAIEVEYAAGEGTGTPEPQVNYGTEDKPLTVAEAIALATAECPSSNNVTAQVVYMKGVITDLGNFNGTYYQNMYFADAGKLDTTIFAYTINVNAGVTTPVVGDTVVICGYIKNYNGTLEFASNNGTFVYIVSNLGGGTTTDPVDPDPTKPEFSPITSPVAGEYAMAMDINGTWYYLTGELSGNYAASTTNVAGAAKIELIADGDGWLIKANGKYVEIIISGTYNNIKFNAERATDIHWVWNAEYSIFTWTNTNDTFWMGTYNTYTTFSASKISYITNNNQYPAKLGTLGGSQGENPGGGEDTPSASASISFADVANRTSYSTTEQVWEQNGIKFTNSKGASTTNVGDYSNPVRLYAKSTMNVEFTSAMKEIVFHCNTTSYATVLEASLASVSGVTVTVNGKDVTVVFDTARTSLGEVTLTAQVRIDSIDVKA